LKRWSISTSQDKIKYEHGRNTVNALKRYLRGTKCTLDIQNVEIMCAAVNYVTSLKLSNYKGIVGKIIAHPKGDGEE